MEESIGDWLVTGTLLLGFLLWVLSKLMEGAPLVPVPPPRSNRPPPRFLRTPRDFELVAAEWLQCWGYEDAVATGLGADGGIDVLSTRVVAQVKSITAPPIGRPYIQQLKGAALGKSAVFFSLCDYTGEAIQWADSAGVALFRFLSYDGTVAAVNAPAVRVMESRRPPPTPPARSSRPRYTRRSNSPGNEGGQQGIVMSDLRAFRTAFALVEILRDADQSPVGDRSITAVLKAIPGIGTKTRHKLLILLGLHPGSRVALNKLSPEQRAILGEMATSWARELEARSDEGSSRSATPRKPMV